MERKFDKIQKKLSSNFLLLYTIIFSITAFFTFFIFIINGKTLVWNGDGYSQHFKALYFYAKWMREILKCFLVDHKISIPTFSISLGLGSDLFTTLQYYVIGDPFTYLSVFAPSKFIVHYYNFMIILRLYFAGLAFCAFCKYKKADKYATIAGSLVYAFCSFAILSSVRHPYFINPMIYFPLLLLGVEKIWNERKPFIMIFSVAIAAASNFYFFYMLVLLVVIYAAITFCCSTTKATYKKNLISVLHIFIASLLGLLIASVFFLPITMFFFQGSRKDSLLVFDNFYTIHYYGRILRDLITIESPGSWLLIGVTAAALPALFLFFKKNGFKTEKTILITLFVVYTLLSTLAWYSVNENFYFSLCIALSAFVILILNPPTAKKLAFCVIIFGITGNAFYQYSIYQNNYVSKFKNLKNFNEEFSKNESIAIKEVKGDLKKSRYSGTEFVSNNNLIEGRKNTQMYWSLINGNINNFYNSTLAAYQNFSPFSLNGFDSRSALETLASTKYFLTAAKDYIKVPYGYKLKKEVKIEEYKKISVYENKNPLPFAYTYKTYLTENDALQ